MPLTLYWYILKDLLKLLAIATGALVMVMSMGFMIKPISEGSLEAWSLLKLLFYVMPGMLTYALPVAAAFASTLVFFRLSADNEITACAMSGISYRSLLVPTAVLGLALTVGTFFLANFVIPGFWQRVAHLAQEDIARWFVKQIDSRQIVKLDRQFIVYADDAWVEDLPPHPDDGQNWPYQRVGLEHVAVGKIDDKSGNLQADFTGELAVADLYKVGNATVASVKLTNAALKHPETGTLVVVREHAFPPKQIPSLFQMKPRMLSLGALNELSEKPDLSPQIARISEDLRESMARQNVLARIRAGLTRSASRSLDLIGPQGEDYTLEAPRVVETDKSLELASEGGRPVVVRIGRGAVLRQRLEAESGRIDVIPGDEPRIAVKLSTVKVLDPRLPADLPEPTLVRTVHLTLLRFAEPIAQPLRETGALDLIRLAERRDEPDVTNGARLLVQEINDLRGRITSAVHERAAMAVCALLVMLMGAVMAMLLRQQVPLVIFFWCFLPAIVAIFMINGGKNMVEADALGVGQWFNAAMVWSGNAFLLAVIAVIYARLARH